jgi:hypothetical protein
MLALAMHLLLCRGCLRQRTILRQQQDLLPLPSSSSSRALLVTCGLHLPHHLLGRLLAVSQALPVLLLLVRAL